MFGAGVVVAEFDYPQGQVSGFAVRDGFVPVCPASVVSGVAGV